MNSVKTEQSEGCPCCGSKDVIEIGRLPDSQWFAGTRLEHPLPGGWLQRCRDCHLKFRNPSQTADEYASLYDNGATTTWVASTARADWELISRYVAKTLPNGGTVLDFGCYTAGLLAQLGSQYARYGVKVNRAAADVATGEIGNKVWSSISDMPDQLRFDVVIASDVIEHIANPKLLVEQLMSKLTDSGILILTTGDADNYLWNRFGANWWYCYYPDHIAFISRDWLEYVSGAVGISIVRCDAFRYFEHSLPRRILDSMLIYFYGLFPTAFLGLVRSLRKMLGRSGSTSIPGAGVSRDHMFVVLGRASGH
jgi:SAM-dependent methyltransferase